MTPDEALAIADGECQRGGLEPPAYRSQGGCSAVELRWQIRKRHRLTGKRVRAVVQELQHAGAQERVTYPRSAVFFRPILIDPDAREYRRVVLVPIPLPNWFGARNADLMPIVAAWAPECEALARGRLDYPGLHLIGTITGFDTWAMRRLIIPLIRRYSDAANLRKPAN